MRNFIMLGDTCQQAFENLGECYHLWTPERFEIIFSSEDDFRCGMNIIGICARLFPNIRILTFEIMSNHFHFTMAGGLTCILDFFETLKKFLSRHFRKGGRTVDWSGFKASTRALTSLEDLRNVIVYNNRNGYIVSRDHTPFSYPWGANRYYFHPDARMLSELKSRPMTLRERQSATNSRMADDITELMMFEGCCSPLSFCSIQHGESLFRDASHYFYLISKNIEANKQIAKEVGESVFYTDNELFAAIAHISRERYGAPSLTEASSSAKLELARIMRYEYNATSKQIMRFLKLSQKILESIGIR